MKTSFDIETGADFCDAFDAISATGSSLVEGLDLFADLPRRSPERFSDATPFVALANGWVECGRPRFVLTSSLASLLVSTRAARMSELDLPAPYDAFVIEVPGEWTSMRGTGPLQILYVRAEEPTGPHGHTIPYSILCASRRGSSKIGNVEDRDHPNNPLLIEFSDNVFRMFMASDMPIEEHPELKSFEIEAVRLLVNACLYISTHKESVSAESKASKSSSKTRLFTVRPPSDLVVTSKFRDYAKSLVAGRSLAERRHALMHMVRGHWKNQACGEARVERKLKWIQPYVRGDDALGKVIERTVIIEGAA